MNIASLHIIHTCMGTYIRAYIHTIVKNINYFPDSKPGLKIPDYFARSAVTC